MALRTNAIYAYSAELDFKDLGYTWSRYDQQDDVWTRVVLAPENEEPCGPLIDELLERLQGYANVVVKRVCCTLE